MEFLANPLFSTTIILTQENTGQSTFSAGICLCTYWQGYSGIWEGVSFPQLQDGRTKPCYFKKANGLTPLFSYTNATEWTQIMPGLRVKHWKKNLHFTHNQKQKLKQYYLKINYHSFCGSQKEYKKKYESTEFHIAMKDTGGFWKS